MLKSKLSMIVLAMTLILSSFAYTGISFASSGSNKGSAPSNKVITRGEAAQTAVQLYERISGKTLAIGENPFRDTKDPNIIKAYAAGFISGVENNRFSPNSAASKQEVADMFYRAVNAAVTGFEEIKPNAVEFKDKAQLAEWADLAVSNLHTVGVLKEDKNGKIKPLAPITLKEATEMVERLYEFSLAWDACSKLASLTLPSNYSKLPTTGATVKSANLVLEGDLTNRNGEFCKVLGAIHPVDDSAPDINFQVNLPTDWNQKVVHFGGGGFNGWLQNGLNNSEGSMSVDDLNELNASFASTSWNATETQKNEPPTPLGQGYVTFGSDSGHSSGMWDASFGMNDESLKNFASDQLKKTKDAAIHLINKRYNSTPEQVYFTGGSEGGREALIIVQRFPEDYDGVIAVYPVLNWIPKAITDNRNAQALYANNGENWIDQDENKLINKTVMNACDALDGAEDGVISNISECSKQEKETEILSKLRCPDGSDLGSTCLSDEEIEVVKSFNAPMHFNFPLANSFKTMPGYSQLQGADIAVQFGTRAIPSVPPADDKDALMGTYADNVIRYKITRDPDLNSMNFNPNEYVDEILKASELLDATNTDISKFQKNGGKLILLHGTEDEMVTPYGSIDYYNQLVERFGQNHLDDFMKFYLVPGFSHGRGNFMVKVDLVKALDTWVTKDKDPGTLTGTDQNPNTFGRTRPVCQYPAFPEYKGSGDINSASNFSCEKP